ncbi:MAG: carbohydrate-binding protein, partial [Bacteroidales bacterium]|nr:carbohydrate-binding protein [Bacteroidales bacterium]
YVLKLSFDGKIPALDKFVDLNCAFHYYLVPGNNTGTLILGKDLLLSSNRKDFSNQWKFEKMGKGLYKIINRADNNKTLTCSDSGNLSLSEFSGSDNQIWKLDKSHSSLLKISNKEFPNYILTVNNEIIKDSKAEMVNQQQKPFLSWNLMEVCEKTQKAFKPHAIPGSIEAEDFDDGCAGDAYYDTDDINQGGAYRTTGIDIEVCSSGTYNVGWTRAGEWLAYTVKINKTANYQVTFHVASANENSKAHLEYNGSDLTGIFTIPNTGAYQKWDVIKKIIKLEAGEHQFRFVVDADGLNLDKMVFEEVK